MRRSIKRDGNKRGKRKVIENNTGKQKKTGKLSKKNGNPRKLGNIRKQREKVRDGLSGYKVI